MSFDAISYLMGHTKGVEDGTGVIVIEEGITCTDDGSGNITITEDNNG